jgi:hypothetical protein
LEIGERVVSDSSAVPTTIGDVSVTTSAAAATTTTTTTTVLSQVLFSSCNHTVQYSNRITIRIKSLTFLLKLSLLRRRRSFSSSFSSFLSGERWSSDDDDTDDTTVCYRRLRYFLYSHYLY